MKEKKSIWTILTGGITSAAPILFSVCKGGACVGVCVSPVASLFGISSATIAASPLVSALEPLLVAISAVSFTISYYTLYVIPKFNCNTDGACGCAPTDKEKRKINITKIIFWLGLVLSIGFLSYFEYSKYQATNNAETECAPGECAPGECSTDSEEKNASPCDSASCDKTSCDLTKSVAEIKSEITCPKCGFKKTEIMPTDVCLLKYVCQKCKAVLNPKDEDCCVFCSYGNHKCPSKQ